MKRPFKIQVRLKDYVLRKRITLGNKNHSTYYFIAQIIRAFFCRARRLLGPR